MPFLALDGLTIPVARRVGPSRMEPGIIGGIERSANGAAFDTITALKRQWGFQTKPLSQGDAEALINMLIGLGHRWRFGPLDSTDRPLVKESGASDSTYLYSDSGLGPTGSPIATVESNTAADGDPVQLLATSPSTYVDVAKFNSAVNMSPAVSNLLSASQRDCEDTPSSDFVEIDSGTNVTLGDNTTHYWQGAKSLEVDVTSAVAFQGAATSFVTGLTGGADYTGSVYLKGDAGGESILVVVQDDIGSDTNKTVTLVKDKWIRVDVTHTLHASATDARIIVETASAATAKWYCDGFQLEAGSFPNPWVDGTRAVGVFDLPLGFFQALRSFSVSFWARGAYVNDGEGNYVLRMFDSGSSNACRVILSSSGKLFIGIIAAGAAEVSAFSTTTLNTATQTTHKHCAVTYNHKTGVIKVFVDGTEEDTDTAGSADFSSLTDVRIGYNTSGLGEFRGYFDDLRIVPYVMSTDQISALASATVEFPQMRQLRATGDFHPESFVNVLVSSVQIPNYLGLGKSTGWSKNNMPVRFELLEV